MLTNLTGKLSNTARIELETNIKVPVYVKYAHDSKYSSHLILSIRNLF